MRLRHAVRMADLACDVEHNIGGAHVTHGRSKLTSVACQYINCGRNGPHIKFVSAAARHGGVDDGHFSAFSDEPVYEITADESKAARHQAM